MLESSFEMFVQLLVPIVQQFLQKGREENDCKFIYTLTKS